ncbi:SAM-dependent methyltransferase [Parabacteroides sp. OttesenSCG-928-K15]|nr:SAM-dependent methyltransferase [Parabacteroides sp. OttesenSCG-928-K15]
MKPSESLKIFLRTHADDDPERLLLQGDRYPEIDMPFAVDQLIARRHIREKLPEWYAREVWFPSRVSAEQCSSESTARYKQQFIKPGQSVCDLTGGLGVDSYYLSRVADKVHYVERFPVYCEMARCNFGLLGATNIEVTEGDGTELYTSFSGIDLFYIDPARRGKGNSRVFALADCEPDLTQLLPGLLAHAPQVVAKLSPMADLQQTMALLPGTREVHVLSVKNDCKELLFVAGRDVSVASPEIHCINYTSAEQYDAFRFSWQEERNSQPAFADEVGRFLYEPNASILKAGAFKVLAVRFGLQKIAVNSHLYTSAEAVTGFPGRSFEVLEVHPFNKQLCKQLCKRLPQANITTRNFPLSVKEIRQRTRIAEGGHVYLFATTLQNGGKVIVECRKYSD